MDASIMDDRLTDKIRKLLAMAEHPNSNENEAAIALQKAQKLLFENNLTRADIKDTDGPSTPAGIGKLDITESVGFRWKPVLMNALARNNLCRVIRSSHNNTIHVFGTYDNVLAVMEMYHWIVPELERMAMKGWTAYKADGTGRERAQTWKYGFFLGATDTIERRLAETMREFETGQGHALVPINKALVTDAVKRVFPHLKTSYSSSRSYDGRMAGRQAGNNINLRPTRKLSASTRMLK